MNDFKINYHKLIHTISVIGRTFDQQEMWELIEHQIDAHLETENKVTIWFKLEIIDVKSQLLLLNLLKSLERKSLEKKQIIILWWVADGNDNVRKGILNLMESSKISMKITA